MIIWLGESRSFYCSNGNCITVWKIYGGTCYIFPGKYYGIINTADNYIQTTTDNNITVYWTNEIPNAMIFGVDRGVNGDDNDYKIVNKDKQKIVLLDYFKDTVKFHKILYNPGYKSYLWVKNDASVITVFIAEEYAYGNNGKELNKQ